MAIGANSDGERAMKLFERFRALRPGNASPTPQGTVEDAARLINLGNAHEDAGKLDSALSLYNDAIRQAPAMARGYLNRGNVLLRLGDLAGAVADYRESARRDPDHPGARFNLGNALAASGQLDSAIREYQNALALKPDFADAELALGNAFDDIGRLDDAIACYRRAVKLRPDSADALTNLGLALNRAKRYPEAEIAFKKVLELQPDRPYAQGNLLTSRLYACDWRHYNEDSAAIDRSVAVALRAITPFQYVPVTRSASSQLKCAQIYAADKYPARTPIWRGERYCHQRIRVAYLSADYHNHATSALMAGLFELHDRQRFEIYAISFGRDDQSSMRERLVNAFDHFIEVRSRTDRQIAELLCELEIDIAIDLKGYTAGARPGILAWRPAPAQVSYLGFPGTLGAPYVDYIIADRWVIPPGQSAEYTEKIVYLPGSYQVNDVKRHRPGATPRRSESGLPQTGFVFCCFNNSYKITPITFAAWMRILGRCPDSVLWLLNDNDAARKNLHRETQAAGIDPARVIFAPRLGLESHLDRHQLANLFLDTTPCNAHTTTSDALWAGLPVLTISGNTFAGRVAESLLRAVGLPEMVAGCLTEYETMAVEFYHDSQRLLSVKERLGKQDCSHPLFDTRSFARSIECAYERIQQRTAGGLPPSTIDLSDS
jgi:predicted O-linked N-acetylglucosamine transferase (SPINDLY family)